MDQAIAVATAQKQMSWLGVVVLDVDRFKAINDTHGHRAGDEVLAELGRRVTEAVGDAGTAGRYGGEEFLIVLPKHDREASQILAERVLEAVRAGPVAAGSTMIAVTASAGVAATYGDRCTVDGMIDAADAAMYGAKDAGRDLVIVDGA